MGGEILSTTTVATWWEVLGRFWPVALISFAISLVATPVFRHIALKKGVVDRPDDFLKPHEKPIPYLGGVAVFLGWLAGILVALVWGQVNIRFGLMRGVAFAGLAIMLIGLFDDLQVMSSSVKLGLNIAVAVFLLLFGLGDDLIGLFPGVSALDLGSQARWLELAYSVPLMIFIVVGACNATNLIDGLDGLCTGVLGIIAIGFFLLATHMRIYEDVDVANERVILALAMLGAAAGFLPFNLNPAKIFLGDAGSMLLGLNAAIIVLLFAEKNLVRWMVGALMVFGLPVSDMLLTLVRRWRNGVPLMEGDRSHFYDQLHDRGYSVRKVVAISYVLTLIFVCAGTSTIYLRTRYVFLVCFVLAVIVVAGIWKFDMVSIERGVWRGGGSRDSKVGDNEV